MSLLSYTFEKLDAFFFFFLIIFIEVQLTDNVVLVLGAQQSDSVVYSFSHFFSMIGYYKVLSIFPCAI